MDAIQKPTGAYRQSGEQELITCPHCNKVLNQHVQLQPNAISANSVDSQAVAAGDIYVPTIVQPAIVRDTEHMQTGQARPDKAVTHVIPGMPQKVVVPTEVPGRPQPAAPVLAVTPAPAQQPRQHGDALQVMDDKIIGGKVTICVLLYGEQHFDLHRRCLNSIIQSVPPSRMDLRVACNQVGLPTMNYLKQLPVTKIYVDYKQRRKYPAMREMFYDKKNPLETNYVIWYDDDSYAMQNTWLSTLCQMIVNQRPGGKVGMYGHVMYHPLQIKPSHDPRQWFRNASWFRGQPFRTAKGGGAPNGNKIHFCVGGHWAISREAIFACEIPDTRLNHNGGDVCIGEQIWQGGYKMKNYNEKKQYIKTSASPRRGFKEKFPWYRAA